MMRIITGTARGTQLVSPTGEETRPTSERAKEATFSSLASYIPGRKVLDLFAGSGQLSLEALSRGAESAVMLDVSNESIRAIRHNIVKTHMEAKVTLLQTDCRSYLRSIRNKGPIFDLVFIDPPFALHLVPELLGLLAECGVLSDDAILVCESEESDILHSQSGSQRVALDTLYKVRRQARYAKAYVTILEKGK